MFSIIKSMNLKFATSQVKAYEVDTEVYQGPLDLLLKLIENAELDITKLSLAKVTDQYLSYMKRMENKEAEEVSAFMVIAAKLIQIKSEALLPRPPRRDEGEEDPGDELAKQLLAYKRYKEIADLLAEREQQGLHTFIRETSSKFRNEKVDFEGITLEDMLRIAHEALEKAQDEEAINHVVSRPKVTVQEKVDLFISHLKRKGEISFFSLLGNRYSKIDVVVSFLALLELMKREDVTVSQEDMFEDIVLKIKVESNEGL